MPRKVDGWTLSGSSEDRQPEFKKNLKDYVYVQKKFIPETVCKQSIKEIEDISFQEHKFYDSETKTYKTRAGSHELHMSWDNISTTQVIMENLHNAISNYQSYVNLPWFKNWNGYSPIRINKYEEKKEMAMHCDHIRDMFDGERKGIPIVTILGILNDNYKGGNFILFDDYDINLKEGDVLIFPSVFMYPHKVKPVTEGIRYSFVSWVW